MDAKTRQAWKYIKTLNYYSKEWGQPLGELVDILIQNMIIDHQEEEKDDFIAGIRKLQAKGWLTGNLDYSQLLDIEDDIENEEEITNSYNISIKPFFKRWYWIPFKWGSGNPKVDAKMKNMNQNKGSDPIQFFVNTIIPIITFIILIIQFFNV